jgi:hypothetical protein
LNRSAGPEKAQTFEGLWRRDAPQGAQAA